MSAARVLMLVTGILEGILGIPFLGGFIVIGFLYTPLLVMFILHIITLVLAASERRDKHGSILGIITSCLAWIPFLGMALHIISAILLLVSFARGEHNNRNVINY